MHDSLHLRNVSRLPPYLRSTALAATKGSLKDLSIVCEALTRDPRLCTSPSALYLLPILYVNLDPTTIPTADALDAITATGRCPHFIVAASVALKALRGMVDVNRMTVQVEAVLDLWPRIWPWMQFLHTYWEFLPTFHPDEEVKTYLANYRIVTMLREHPEARRVIYSQRGLRSIFTKAWTMILLDDVLADQSVAFLHSFALLAIVTNELFSPQNFQEVIDGAGGSLNRLATAVLKQMSLALASTMWSNVHSDESLHALVLGTTFLDIDDARSDEWMSLLLSRGIITYIVSALRLAGMTPFSGMSNDWPETFFACLCKCLTTPPVSDVWVAEAVEAGLLHVFICCASHKGYNTAQIEFIINQVLPGSLVSRAVIVQMKKALLDVQEISGTRRFRESTLFNSWEKLVLLANTRINTLDTWEAAGRPSYLACDNIQCGKTGPKGKFKRCSGCWSANYCSSDCQSLDWQDGHRSVCADLRSERCLDPEVVPSRERSFMRALIHSDYKQHWFDIAMDEIKLIRNHPNEEFYIIFDYTPLSGVMPVIQNRNTLPDHGVPAHASTEVEWARLAKSNGRMRMHAMRIADGPATRLRMYPVRGGSAVFHRGLLMIAQLNPVERGMTQIEAESHDERYLRALVEEVASQEVILGIH
ncbi:hypothetical protein C8R47DRAFT_1195796 [Mycena vitilis]|nr:hypothetical protein C8R47DRAFT_1195796 [Mycena vitilis]